MSAVAAFDFDGTITRRDTLVPFVAEVAGRPALAAALAAMVPLALERDRGRRRDAAKALLVRRLLRGRSETDTRSLGSDYARRLPERYRPEVLERIEWHRARGHRLVLVSASLALYATPAAAALGFDDVIATELEVDSRSRFTGLLEGPNVRGPEKATRLVRLLGGECSDLWAYGNSRGDDEMLAMADHPVRVDATFAHGAAGSP